MVADTSDTYTRRILPTFIIDHLSSILAEQDIIDALSNSEYMRLATTLTGGFLKTHSWVTNHVYLEHILTPIGEQYMANFFASPNFLHLQPTM
jgi:hypothetical protein